MENRPNSFEQVLENSISAQAPDFKAQLESMDQLDQGAWNAWKESHAVNSITGQWLGKAALNAFADQDLVISPSIRKAQIKAGLKEVQTNYVTEALKEGYSGQELQFFIGLESDSEYQSTKIWADSYRKMNDNIAQHPVAGFTGALTGAIDPIYALPATKIASLAKVGGQFGLSSKFYSGVSVASQAGLFGATSFAADKALQDQNPFITDEEIYLNTVVNAVIGSVAGGVLRYRAVSGELSRVSAKAQVKAAQDLAKDLKSPHLDNSVGAAEVAHQFQVKNIDLPEAAKSAISPFQRGRAPIINVLESKIPMINQLGRRLNTTDLKLKGGPDENMVNYAIKFQKGQAAAAQYQIELRPYYTRYLKSTDQAVPEKFNIKNKSGKLSYSDFQTEIYRTSAKRRIDPEFKSSISEVNKFLDEYHTPLMKRIGLKGKELKRFSEELDLDKAYMPRHWNQEKIRLLIRSDNARVWKKMEARLAELESRPFADSDEMLDAWSAMLEKIKNGTVDEGTEFMDDAIRPTSDLSLATKKANKVAKPFKARDERWDFFEDIFIDEGLVRTDIDSTMPTYILQTNRAFSGTELLKSLNADSFSDFLKAARTQADEIMNKLPEGTSDKVRKAIRAQQDFDIDQTEFLLNTYMGRTPIANKYGQMFRDLIMMTSLGMVVPASLGDVAIGVYKQGFENVFKFGWKPLGKETARLFKLMSKSETRELMRQDLHSLNIALDIHHNNAMRTLLDGEVRHVVNPTALDRVHQGASDVYGKLSGISYWDHANRDMQGNVAANRIFQVAKNRKAKFNAADLADLRDSGFTDADLDGILKRIQEHGAVDGEGAAFGLTYWKDDLLKNKVESYLARKVNNSAALMPVTGETPSLFLTTEAGRYLGMFKSFSTKAQHSLAWYGLQHRDSRTISGMFSMILSGYVSYAVKELLNGREPETGLDAIVGKGLVQSGLMGLQMEYLVGLTPWSQSIRYGAGGIIPAPVIGYAANTAYFIGGLTDKDGKVDLDSTDVQRLRKLIPYQNLFYVKLILDKALGVKEKRKAKSSKQSR